MGSWPRSFYPWYIARGYLCFKVRWQRRLCLHISVFPSSGEGPATRLEAFFFARIPTTSPHATPGYTTRSLFFARIPTTSPHATPTYVCSRTIYWFAIWLFCGEKYGKLCWRLTSKFFEQAWKIFSIKTRLREWVLRSFKVLVTVLYQCPRSSRLAGSSLIVERNLESAQSL